MKKGRSTSAPNKEEAARIVAVKELGACMACEVLAENINDRCDGGGVDYHHLKSGNIRRGHMFGFGLCVWHHRGHPLYGNTAKHMRNLYGPSLMDGGKRFSMTYGTDDELLARQNQLLG